MHRRFAVLLDAGFVKRKLKSSGEVSANRIQQLVEAIRKHECLQDCLLHRVYYYDAAPLGRSVEQPVTGEVIEYDKTPVFQSNVALVRDVAKLPHFALCQGECSHDGWMAKFKWLKSAGNYDAGSDTLKLKSSDLKPVIKQKGVDMRIGMDIAALTLKKHVEVIVLVTADSDFIPAMKFARREGAQLYLFSLGHGTKEDVVENADLMIVSTAKSLMDALAA
ncbi:NYN domain-containing protein [Xanthomonas sp. LF06-19]|uniref:NYN domain-containing protein n=1 Tax=Xanthomonas sp. LF06-19 TaxID=3097551 RepID=UPI002A7F3C48|nr:NYN domain-containing protein [Xanthomonas sp. LF06-19]MDY4285055.1 NYN domain-containing protein [Xanthomonas sp. LF06-19]